MSGHHYVSNDPEGGDARCFRCDERWGKSTVCEFGTPIKVTPQFPKVPLTRQARDDLELRFGEPR